jgi:hypothetical protein
MTDRAAGADDTDDYEDDPEEDDPGTAFLDLAVNTLAGAVTGAGGYAIGGLPGALVGSSAPPFLALLFRTTVGPWWADRARRAEKMLETAAEMTGLSPEELAARAAESEQTRFLTDRAVKAATNTIWPEGIRAIGRAYAAGLLAKDKPVMNIRLRALGIMEDLDEMHVRLLELLVRYEPEMRFDGVKAIPQQVPSYVDMGAASGDPDNPVGWSIGRRKWTTKQINGVAPDLQQVLTSLLGELREGGLVQENDTAPDAFKRLSANVAKQVNDQAGQMRRRNQVGPINLQPATIPSGDPTWSPTELGEKILGFYAEAGAEDSQDPDGHPGQATS